MAQCAILSLGSNVEPRFDYLRQAVAHLCKMAQSQVLRISPVYETEPVLTPSPDVDPDFLNCIVIVETDLEPLSFFTQTQEIELHLHRTRSVYGAPRTIDIDIISFGAWQISQGPLILPHPRAHLRRFVLQPLADLLPQYCLPGFSRTVSALLADCTDHAAVVRYAASLTV
jgi:2-amino-4-hydroxy-6-hydroxymethyldihydropteridine diphosphokinase